jgi:hypothetical protein
MTKIVYLYAPISEDTFFHRFENVRDVTHDGNILSFTDQLGNRHITSAPWEVVQK